MSARTGAACLPRDAGPYCRLVPISTDNLLENTLVLELGLRVYQIYNAGLIRALEGSGIADGW